MPGQSKLYKTKASHGKFTFLVASVWPQRHARESWWRCTATQHSKFHVPILIHRCLHSCIEVGTKRLLT